MSFQDCTSWLILDMVYQLLQTPKFSLLTDFFSYVVIVCRHGCVDASYAIVIYFCILLTCGCFEMLGKKGVPTTD